MSEPRPQHEQSPWRYDAAELADLYAAGALSDSERAELDARIVAQDEVLIAQLRRVAAVSALLADSFRASEPPPPGVRATLIDRLAAMKKEERDEAALVAGAFAEEGAVAASVAGRAGGAPDARPQGVVFRAAAEGRWWPTGLPGVWGKTLFKSRQFDRETLLVRCEPGALIPRHAHEGIEELIVLRGTLLVGHVLLGPGDYIRSAPGADHGDAISPDGCLCLFFTSHGVMSPRSQLIMFIRGMGRRIRSLFGRRS